MITYNSGAFYLWIALSYISVRLIGAKISRNKIIFGLNLAFISLLFFFRKKQLLILLATSAFVCVALSYLSKQERSRKAGAALIFSLVLVLLGVYRYHFILGPMSFMGLSFLALRIAHVTFDVVNKDLNNVDTLTAFNYLLYFPSYLSGPLDRFQNFDIESKKPANRLNATEIYSCVYRITLGAFKKTVIANHLVALSIDHIHSEDFGHLSTAKILLALYVYTATLYFDFSGYSDIAIGVSKLFGVSLPENFNKPFLSKNIQDFWQRWHMTFMEWLRDYVYYPIARGLHGMGLESVSTVAAISFLITFLFAGIWHGYGLHFIEYGLYHGIGFVIWIFYREMLKQNLSPAAFRSYHNNPVIQLTARLLTFHYIVGGWFFYLDKTEALRVIFGRLL